MQLDANDRSVFIYIVNLNISSVCVKVFSSWGNDAWKYKLCLQIFKVYRICAIYVECTGT